MVGAAARCLHRDLARHRRGEAGLRGPCVDLGRGANPINFVSARDVAAVTHRVTADKGMRGRIIDVAGPANLTMREFVTAMGATSIRHIPRAALRVLAVAARPVSPAFARQAAAAIAMDTVDMTADAAGTRAAFPELEWRSVADVLAERATRGKAA